MRRGVWGARVEEHIGVKLRKDELTMRSVRISIRSGISKGVFPLDRQSTILAVCDQRLRVETLVRPMHCLPHQFLT